MEYKRYVTLNLLSDDKPTVIEVGVDSEGREYQKRVEPGRMMSNDESNAYLKKFENQFMPGLVGRREPTEDEVAKQMGAAVSRTREAARQMGEAVARGLARAKQPLVSWDVREQAKPEPNRASEFAKVVSALSGLDRKITRPKMSQEAEDKCRSRYDHVLLPFLPGNRVYAKPNPPAPPAKPHPLQRLAEPPSVFGQSLWRPWEM